MGDKPSVVVRSDRHETDVDDIPSDMLPSSHMSTEHAAEREYSPEICGSTDQHVDDDCDVTANYSPLSAHFISPIVPTREESPAPPLELTDVHPLQMRSPKALPFANSATNSSRNGSSSGTSSLTSPVKSPTKSPVKSPSKSSMQSPVRAEQSDVVLETCVDDDMQSYASMSSGPALHLVEPPSPSTSSTHTVISVIHNPTAPSTSEKWGTSTVNSARQQPSTSSAASVVRHNSTRSSAAPPKQTLGDLLLEIESRSASLLQSSNFCSSNAVADLHFLSQQSRYNIDVNVKRRLLNKIVDCGFVDIFLAVFTSAASIDYFSGSCLESPPAMRTSVTGRGTGSRIGNRSMDVNEVRDVASDTLNNLRSIITVAWNASDKIPSLCEQFAHCGVVERLLIALDDPHLAVSELHDHDRLFVVKGYLGILTNVVRSCDDDVTRELYRLNGAVKRLQQYLRCSLLAVRTKALIILSYVASEAENDVINATDKNLVFAVKMLQSALDNDNHYSSKYGYWAVEIISGINRLAGFESNKERLHLAGLLPLCLRLLDSQCSDDEAIVTVQTFWILAFNANLRTDILACSDYMHELENLSVNASRDEIKRAALSTLWVLDRNRFRSRQISAGNGEHGGCHVLMLAHHTSRHIVLKVRHRLRNAGYKVQIDPDSRPLETGGVSGMESMVETVDKACIVLVFLSNRLKNSPACRTELEYIVTTRKPLVPIRIHQTFVPDGWLIPTITNMAGLDFCDDDKFETSVSILLQQVATAVGPLAAVGRPRSGHDGSSSQHLDTVGIAESTLDVATGLSAIETWSSADVQIWLRNNDLTTLGDRLSGVTGDLLLEIRRMQATAPESFYTALRVDLSLDFLSVLKFTRALSLIPTDSTSE